MQPPHIRTYPGATRAVLAAAELAARGHLTAYGKPYVAMP
jgi:hypothetical protein